MKTSFYFFLWIIIYPILGQFDNSTINNNSFIIALAFVWGLSWFLNRLIPNTITYERISQIVPILEDVYTSNVEAFRKRLSRDAKVETATALYLIVTTIVIAMGVFMVRVNNFNDWIALIVFAFFAYGSSFRAFQLLKALNTLKQNPTGEQCVEISNDTYKLDYDSYYESRQFSEYAAMFPQQPRFYQAFQILSIIIAAITTLIGLIFIIGAIGIVLKYSFCEPALADGVIILLYGSLATYFGIRDFISILVSFKSSNVKIKKL